MEERSQIRVRHQRPAEGLVEKQEHAEGEACRASGNCPGSVSALPEQADEDHRAQRHAQIRRDQSAGIAR